MKNKKHMKKGFSLVELVIVLAIITVLAAIVSLAWNRIINRQRLATANSKAKVVFNAVQNEAIKYSTQERSMEDGDRLIGSGDFYFYWDGHTGRSVRTIGSVTPAADSVASGTSGDAQQRFGRAINNILNEQGAYAVHINNYVVQSVTFATDPTNKYMGAFPAAVKLDNLGDDRVNNFQLGKYSAATLSGATP